jgi:hypothetical protein
VYAGVCVLSCVLSCAMEIMHGYDNVFTHHAMLSDLLPPNAQAVRRVDHVVLHPRL